MATALLTLLVHEFAHIASVVVSDADDWEDPPKPGIGALVLIDLHM
jgi:hypothetical protein